MARSSSRGYSLLELLLAMALVAILVTATLAAYSAVTRATELDAATQALADLLADARSDAVTQNTTVEVRLYDVPDATDSTPAYRVAQLHALKNDGTMPALSTPLLLPATIVLDAAVEHSSLIGANTVRVTPDASDSRLNAQTKVFHFLADGSIDANPAQGAFLTLRTGTAAEPSPFPNNWACLRIDAATGRVQIFRP